ncbi:MAG: hypothetical protein ACJA0P_004002 [Planctomycetota bacterium]|jgi:hypothetical protein
MLPLTSLLSRLSCAFVASLLILCLPASAQDEKPGEGMEKFEEVDPYTENDPEKIAKLGYVSMGSFGWGEGNRTENVQETMGGLDFLWVETEHFRIGSSLNSYKMTNDKIEKASLKAEFKELKAKLGKFKAPRRKLDPWVRLHLYALRAEKLYAQFVKDFGLEALADSKEGPYLGHPKKFRLLLCERKSELVRYQQAYEPQFTSEISFASGKLDAGMIFGVDAENIRDGYKEQAHKPVDAMLYCAVNAGLARSFIDGHGQGLFRAPRWLAQAAAHYYARQADERWVLAGYNFRNLKDGHWEWDESVASMVKNEFFCSMAEMTTWLRDHKMNGRDHMNVTSKLEFMIAELSPKLRTYMDLVVRPVKNMTEESTEELEKRQRAALMDAFGMEPEAFDEAWAEWVEDKK